MKKIFSVIFALAAMLLLPVSCNKIDVDDLEMQDLTNLNVSQISLTKSQREITRSINDFSYEMYREVCEDGDVLISPFSISLALSMLTTGAGGNTEQQLLSALGFEGKTTEELDTYYAKVMDNIVAVDPSTSLGIANAIWSDKTITLKDQFVEDCEKYFDSTAESVDFTDPATLNKLNDWTREHTNGKIEKMMESLPTDALAILANALYFNASWPFEFTRLSDRIYAKVKITYFSGENFTGVQLPYGNGAFAMRIILPSEGASLKSVAEKYNGSGNVANGTAVVSLNLPVFSFSYQNHLKKALNNLGVTDAFSPAADFSKMSDCALCVGDVLHKTCIDVNEKGTEAAAITVVYMVGASGVEEIVKEMDFTVDRDFIFEIVDRSTGLTLFIGQHKI